MPFYLWSHTASDNGNSDPTINFLEGQTPGSLNDSGRAEMAVLKKWGDDIAGAIVTSGSSTAYTVTSYSAFTSLALMANQMIAFTPHTTNGATVTLNVDSLGAKPLRSAPNVELLAGTIIQGTPYVATYNNSDAAWYLQNFFGNPYNVPLGAGMDFWLPTAPNSSFVFPIGQAISRTTYSALFALMGTTYGVGDASTTFNLPDKTGRASVMKEASATRLTSTHFGGNSTALGAVGGSESTTLTLAQLPTGITSSGSNTISVTSTTANTVTGSIISDIVSGGAARVLGSDGINQAIASSGVNTINVTSTNTSGNAHRTVQPTIVCNYIMRII